MAQREFDERAEIPDVEQVRADRRGGFRARIVELGRERRRIARGVSKVDRDVRPGAVQLARDGGTDAARAARDQHRLAR
jgi:hypothetical protein